MSPSWGWPKKAKAATGTSQKDNYWQKCKLVRKNLTIQAVLCKAHRCSLGGE
jgi:hypothetical protein